VIFLDQLGADGDDPRVRSACAYVLAHTQSVTAGFAASGGHSEAPPPPSGALHCLHGNLLRALLGFGWLEDESMQRAIDWQARAITGEEFSGYYRSGTSRPTFCCGHNQGLPCAWGAIKALSALARIPPGLRTPQTERAIEQGVAFLLSSEPSAAAYPAGWGNATPSAAWFKLGFPSGYVADVLQNLEVLCELGLGSDARLQRAVAWLIDRQDARGRWTNQYAYHGKTWADFERQGQPSKWVTLRACHVIKAASV
jgi:hypothetical protein